jgi:hypothetical protein
MEVESKANLKLLSTFRVNTAGQGNRLGLSHSVPRLPEKSGSELRPPRIGLLGIPRFQAIAPPLRIIPAAILLVMWGKTTGFRFRFSAYSQMRGIL